MHDRCQLHARERHGDDSGSDGAAMWPRQFPGDCDKDAIRRAKLSGERIRERQAFARTERRTPRARHARLANMPMPFGSMLKENFLAATAISIGVRSPKSPCIGLG